MTIPNTAFMLAEVCTEMQARTLLDTKQYVAEVKFDGHRVLLKTGRNGKIEELINRRNVNVLYKFPELQELAFSNNSVFDGEIVVLNNGVSDFNLIQRRAHSRSHYLLARLFPSTIVLFDCLQFEGRNIASEPFSVRRKVLESAFIPKTHATITPQYSSFDVAWNDKASKEGIMVKSLNSPYVLKRTEALLKCKKWKTALLPVLGFESRNTKEIGVLQTELGLVNFVVSDNVKTYWEAKIRNKQKLSVLVKFLELTKNGGVMRMPVMLELIEGEEKQ